MMHPTRELIDSLEVHAALDSETLAHVLDALSSCEEAVTACAAGMLAAQDIERMRSSVLRDLDCSDVPDTGPTAADNAAWVQGCAAGYQAP
jgi:hypothetical protein